MRKCVKQLRRNEEMGSLSIFLSEPFLCDHTIHQTFWLGIGSRSHAWLLCTTLPDSKHTGPKKEGKEGIRVVLPSTRRHFLLCPEEWL